MKTRSQRNKKGWLLGKKVEQKTDIKNLFYVFVNFKDLDELPDYYIIPHNDFAEYVSAGHKKWLQGKQKSGKPRRDSNIRSFVPDKEDKTFAEGFRDNWELLGIL
ncbi:MAG: hypothetical protein AAF927_02335 [Bacteroidota bacterium]